MLKRLVAFAALAVGGVAASLVATAGPASAAPPGCNALTGSVVWSTQKEYNIPAGGWCIVSDPGNPPSWHEMVWQSDGNLVRYNLHNGQVIWASNTCTTCGNPGGRLLKFQKDGNIVIYNSTGHALWSTGASAHRTNKTSFVLSIWTGNPESCGLGLITLHQDIRQLDPDMYLHRDARCA